MNVSKMIKANTVMNTIYTHDSFTQVTPHAHRSIEMVYVASGMMGIDTYPVGSARKKEEVMHVDIFAGQFFILDSFVPHLQLVPNKAHMLILEIDTHQKGIFPKDILLSTTFALSCDPLKNLCNTLNRIMIFRDNRNVVSIFTELLRLLYNNYHNISNEYFEIDLELALKRLIIEICKCQQLTILGKRHNSYVAKTLAYLDSHYFASNLSDSVTAMLGISMHQLNVYLKNELNMSFNALLTERRLDSAQSLLKSTNLSVGAIALKTGYASLRHFEATFKKRFGTTPKEYRLKSEDQGFVFWTDAEDLTRVMEDFRICLHDEA